MTWARTDQKDGTWSGATNGATSSHTFSIGEKVIAVSQMNGSVSFTNFSDTLSNTWTTLYSSYNGNDSSVALGICDVTAAGSSGVTATWGASSSGSVAIIAGTGLSASYQSGKVDSHFITPIITTTDSGDASAAGVTPSAQPCYLFAFFSNGYGVLMNAGTGMTMEYTPPNWHGNGQDGIIVSQRLTSLSAVKGLCTPQSLAASGMLGGVIVIISEAGGGFVNARNGIALSTLSAIDGVSKAGIGAINGFTI